MRRGYLSRHTLLSFCWNSGHGSFTFNEAVFPDPAAVLQQIHNQHVKVIVHIVPPAISMER